MMLPTSRNSVFMGPGHTAVTVMSLRFSSSLRPTVKEDTYALLAPYTVIRGVGQKDAMEDVLRMRPPPAYRE